MANFAYNWYSHESRLNQYGKYLQNQNYVNQIDNAIRDTGKMNAALIAIQTREVKEVQNAIKLSSQGQEEAIRKAGQEHREAIEQASNAICSTLESGFSDLNYNLEDIKDGINGLSNLVGHGFSLLVEGQKITHTYLGQIQNLLRIPDSQKQRVYHIDEGMKYLQNAFRQNPDSDFYTDAFEEFQAALAQEKKDFFSLYHIGFIYLKSTKHLDPKNAEIFFRSSARYYLAEALVSGTNFSNALLQSHKGFLLEGAEAMLFAGEACYLQEKFSAAVELAQEAWKTFPDLTKAGLMQAKYLAANKQLIEAVTILEKAIRINRYLAREVPLDLDLNSKPEILNLIEKLRIEAVEEAKEKYELCRKVILPNSIASSYLSSIEVLIKLETLLEAKEATDTNRVSVKTNSTRPQLANTTHIKQLLVIGNGNSATRVILTNFHSSLNKIITLRGGTTEFEFKSINADAGSKEGTGLGSKKFDAYLFLLPEDSSYIDFHKQKFVYAFPTAPMGISAGSGNGKAFENTFLTELFDADKNMIYSGEINFHFDPTKNELYDEAALELVKEISKANVLLW